ncbi:MAG: DUF3429 domain-containing protein [Gammaproteobacteria bacterium]|nr:DUF3429 domain-containing protein [Gammaproteobacteria bacterium]
MQLERMAKTLGYAGLIPFIVFSTGTWMTLPLMENAHTALMTYAAIILSFMGAVHWGLAMSQNSSHANCQLAGSVVPALLGWLALLIPMLYGYGLLVLSFVVLYFADRLAGDKGLVPSWYLPMRVRLTTVVVVCLVIAAFSVSVF